MIRIGLLSDTHNYIDDRIIAHLKDCDEVWHAGDIGSLHVLEALEDIKPVRAVYGNIDGHQIRGACPKSLRFMCEEVKVWITHIGGYPKKYDRDVVAEITKNTPDLFIMRTFTYTQGNVRQAARSIAHQPRCSRKIWASSEKNLD